MVNSFSSVRKGVFFRGKKERNFNFAFREKEKPFNKLRIIHLSLVNKNKKLYLCSPNLGELSYLKINYCGYIKLQNPIR